MRFPSLAVVAGLVAGAAFVVACGDLFHGTDWETLCDHDASAPGCSAGGGKTTGAPTSSKAATGSGGSGGASSGGGGGSGGADPCLAYCSEVIAGCMASAPQYETQSNCVNVCEILPHVAGAMADDIPCRAAYAAKLTNKPSLCVEAGPGGGGECGPICDAYCGLMVLRCESSVGGPTQCATACAGFDATTPYSTAVQTGDSLACRLYWAVQAVDNSSLCTHAAPASDVCVDAD